MVYFELALRCVLVYMITFEANCESDLDLVYNTFSEKMNNLERSFELKMDRMVKQINDHITRIERIEQLIERNTICNQCCKSDGVSNKIFKTANTNYQSNCYSAEVQLSGNKYLITLVNTEKNNEVKLTVQEKVSVTDNSMSKSEEYFIGQIMQKMNKQNFKGIRQIETDEDSIDICPGIDTMNDKTDREMYIENDRNIGDFIICSRITKILSIRLTNDDDVNERSNIKNLDLIRHAIGLSFDCERKLIFYSDVERGDIHAVDLTGASFHAIVEGYEPTEGLAYERVTGDLYWASSAYSCISKINVRDALNKNSKRPKIVVQLSQFDYPRTIVVDSCSGLIYWTNWNTDQPRIQRLDLNSNNIENIIVTDIQSPYGLAIDHKTRMLYWSDVVLEKIERCDMDGSNRQVVIASKIQPSFGLLIHGDYMFWTDWTFRSVIRANKYNGTEKAMVYKDLKHQPMHILANVKECVIDKCYSEK